MKNHVDRYLDEFDEDQRAVDGCRKNSTAKIESMLINLTAEHFSDCVQPVQRLGDLLRDRQPNYIESKDNRRTLLLRLATV